MPALGDRTPLVPLAKRLDRRLHPLPGGGNFGSAFAVQREFGGLDQRVAQSRLAARGRRAEMDAPDRAERGAQFRFCNGAGGVVRGAVAARLYDDDGLVRAAELADIIDPIAQRPIAEQCVRRGGIARLER
jgi:hypothetical protein